MAHYLWKRVLTAVPVFFGITVLVFLLMNAAPADITDLAGSEGGGTAGADWEQKVRELVAEIKK